MYTIKFGDNLIIISIFADTHTYSHTTIPNSSNWETIGSEIGFNVMKYIVPLENVPFSIVKNTVDLPESDIR